MSKKNLNQNSKFIQELVDFIEPNFIFNNKPINRLNVMRKNEEYLKINKTNELSKLKKKINSIENCKIKNNSKEIIFGDGDINSPIMLIGETPGKEEIISCHSFQGESGALLKKMLLAININLKDVYCTYSINFRPQEDRKPSNQEIKRYSIFLKEHISIINPKIIILMGATAMEAVTGLSNKITNERGKWKEILIKNKTILIMVTYSPSYLIRFPDNKKFSWEDLKKIRQKIKELNIKI